MKKSVDGGILFAGERERHTKCHIHVNRCISCLDYNTPMRVRAQRSPVLTGRGENGEI